MAPVPSAGGSLTGTNGIAKNPNSGTIYTINKQSAVSGRVLGKLDVPTGLVTIVGNLGDNFSSITFRGDSLFGVTGDGATVPETVYLIDTATAAKTLFRALGNGADGEIISYNPTDDMIYHWSGNGTIVFEKFSPVNAGDPTINIPITGSTNGETFGSVFIGNNQFLNSNISSAFNHWNTDGTVSSQFGSMPDDLRGLAFYTCERQLSGPTGYCTGDSAQLLVTNAFSYQWVKDGVDIPGATDTAYFASTPGVYNCRVHDVCGTDTLGNSITVQEHNLPVVAVTGSAAYCTGDSTVLTGTSGGTSQWYLDGAPIAGATTSTFAVTVPGVYNMIKTNLNGCSDSSATGITVIENALPVVGLSAAQNVACIDADSIQVTGFPAGGTYSANIVAGDLFVPADAGAGVHQVTYDYTDGNGCASADTVDITVNDLPVVSASPSTNTACFYDGLITLTGSPAGGLFTGTGVTGTSFDPAAGTVGTNNVTYSYTDGNGCANTAGFTIAVDSCLSVTELNGWSASVYPNPANETIHLVYSGSQEGVAVIRLIDVTGKAVYTTTMTQMTSADVSVRQLENGTYWMQVETTQGMLTQKLMVIH